MAKPKAPTGLRSAGRALWRSIAGTYELRPDELRILADACREADLVERLESELSCVELMVKGTTGPAKGVGNHPITVCYMPEPA